MNSSLKQRIQSGVQALLGLALVLLFLVQPVLALTASQLGRAACPMQSGGCCDSQSSSPGAGLADQESSSCCASVLERPQVVAFSDDPDGNNCGCKLDLDSKGQSAQALLRPSKEAEGKRGLRRRIQIQQTLNDSLICWQAIARTLPHGGGALGGPERVGESYLPQSAALDLNWTRVDRGVVGFLAFISLARI